jgi:molybdopterin-guanine dinucleotide biosynthesis protein A
MIVEMSENISGVILAGGENRRYGGINKSNTIIGGSTIILRIVRILSEIFGEIIIVTNTPEEFESFNTCKIAEDLFKKAGPLAGIHSAMKASSKGSLFVIAGDMPFPDKEIILDQIRVYSTTEAEAVVPRVNGKEEPLHAIYNNSILDKLNSYLSASNRYGVIDFLQKLNVQYIDLPDNDETKRAFFNVNTPLDAAEADLLV